MYVVYALWLTRISYQMRIDADQSRPRIFTHVGLSAHAHNSHLVILVFDKRSEEDPGLVLVDLAAEAEEIVVKSG